MKWLSDYIRMKVWGVITHTYFNFNGGLVEPTLKFRCYLVTQCHVNKKKTLGGLDVSANNYHVFLYIIHIDDVWSWRQISLLKQRK